MISFDSVRDDLRYALRTLRRTAPLSIGVTLTLAIGIGINAVILSLFNGLLFRSPATREPSTFVAIYARPSGCGTRKCMAPTPWRRSRTSTPSAWRAARSP